MSQIIATFYKFVKILDLSEKQASILAECQAKQIKGTILLAKEGINGTISGSREAIDAVVAFLSKVLTLTDLEYKESTAEYPPFKRLKVKLKKEIVTIGIPSVDPTEQVGIYVTPSEWNKLLEDPEVLVIDTRNQYEVAIGTFKNAENPETANFRQFPEYVVNHLDPTKHKKIAMFCTGGIRCEKASSFMLSQGFKEVYHLKGGILKYLEEVPQPESMWQGECFVFDERVALKEGLSQGSYQLCDQCGYPIDSNNIICPNCGHSSIGIASETVTD